MQSGVLPFVSIYPSRAADRTGLGLAVVRSIAELHCGAVEVNSVIRAGAAFVLRFPH